MGYQQLTISEREVIMIEHGNGVGVSEIARQLQRSVSTISRELARNDRGRGYRAHVAEERAQRLRMQERREPILSQGWRRIYVDEHLREYWSPQQIAGRRRRDYPLDPTKWVSHETIYRYILRAAQQGIDYEPYLRQGHRRHRYGYRGNHRFKRIRGFKKIEERPVVVSERSRLGDWESDTLRGSGRTASGIATHVERKTRYLVLAKLDTRQAATYNEATRRAFASQPALFVKTMTVDNGMEFSLFAQLEHALQTQVYFATPYHAWERGQNENTNGLLRQFFPKSADLTAVTQDELRRVEARLNHRPRKCLMYRTPAEALKAELVALGY